MLRLVIPEKEIWDEKNQRFLYTKDFTIALEHSLVSISKWESKWKIPFLNDKNKTAEQLLDYIKCMTITQNVPEEAYYGLGNKEIEKINEYINDPMTATNIYTFDKQRGRKEVITSELIYYWMISFNIPFECQKWHINKLLSLIKVCSVKNSPPRKMGRNEILERNRILNEQRKLKYNTRG